MKKRLMSILLTLCLTLTLLPAPATAAGWPFVPNSKHMTTGRVKSGWYLIFSHDGGSFRIDGNGIVSPSRRWTNAFYVEHLGGEKYYVRAPQGGYLGYTGEKLQSAQIVVSDKPFKWQFDIDNQGGVVRYQFVADADTKYVIQVGPKNCTATEDSVVFLMYGSGQKAQPRAKFDLTNWGVQSFIPQWWKDYQAGKPAPPDDGKTPPVFTDIDVPAGLAGTSKQEWHVLRATNIERAKAGLPLLVTFDTMQKMAGVRGDELVKLYSHTRPNGKDPFSVFKEQAFSYTMGAENIAKGQSSAEDVVDAWMNSEGHKKNILTESLRYMGVGYTNSGHTHWVQLFATNNDSDCVSLTYNKDASYFVLKLKNGITAYAPYHAISSPTVNGKVTFNYPGAASAGEAPAPTPTPGPKPSAPSNGWYNLRVMYNYVNINAAGGAELRKKTSNEAYYAESKGNSQITLKMANGKYLGISGAIKNGVQLAAVDKPYLWSAYTENNADIFSLRPAANLKMAVNASGQKNADGTQVILWTYESFDAPNHAEFRFIPTDKPAPTPTPAPAVKPTKVTLDRSGTVKLQVGSYIALKAKLAPANAASKLTWASSNKKVATVSSDGVVDAKKVGTATITVTTANKKKASVKVKVIKATGGWEG